jgi:hypothetical protein
MTTHTATARPPAPTLAELVEQLAELERLDPIAQAQAARKLATVMPVALAAIADAAVYDATRELSQPTVAGRLGVTVKAVEKAVRQHRQRTGI